MKCCHESCDARNYRSAVLTTPTDQRFAQRVLLPLSVSDLPRHARLERFSIRYGYESPESQAEPSILRY